MTAPTPEKIQRWMPPAGELLERSGIGWFVRHEDHLRHLKLAQIAVLEECIAEGYGNDLVGDWLRDKIAALRKEIEE